MGKSNTKEEVKSAIKVVIDYLAEDWGFCDKEDFSFGCASCEAEIMRMKLKSLSELVEE